MNYQLLSAEFVELIHDIVLNQGELAGRAKDKSLESTLARVDNRLAYGMIEDVFDLAAAYAAAISQGHCFNDANKRTAYRSMIVCLELNNVVLDQNTIEVGDTIIRTAQGLIDQETLADWLRNKAR